MPVTSLKDTRDVRHPLPVCGHQQTLFAIRQAAIAACTAALPATHKWLAARAIRLMSAVLEKIELLKLTARHVDGEAANVSVR